MRQSTDTLVGRFYKKGIAYEYGEELATCVHLLRDYIARHEEAVERDGLKWAPARDSVSFLQKGGKKALQEGLILKREQGDKVFYALSRRMTSFYDTRRNTL